MFLKFHCSQPCVSYFIFFVKPLFHICEIYFGTWLSVNHCFMYFQSLFIYYLSLIRKKSTVNIWIFCFLLLFCCLLFFFPSRFFIASLLHFAVLLWHVERYKRAIKNRKGGGLGEIDMLSKYRTFFCCVLLCYEFDKKLQSGLSLLHYVLCFCLFCFLYFISLLHRPFRMCFHILHKYGLL